MKLELKGGEWGGMLDAELLTRDIARYIYYCYIYIYSSLQRVVRNS